MDVLEHDPLSVLTSSVDGLFSESKSFSTTQGNVGESLFLVGSHVLHTTYGVTLSKGSQNFSHALNRDFLTGSSEPDPSLVSKR